MGIDSHESFETFQLDCIDEEVVNEVITNSNTKSNRTLNNQVKFTTNTSNLKRINSGGLEASQITITNTTSSKVINTIIKKRTFLSKLMSDCTHH